MSYNLRIDENFLRGDHVDGEVLQHTDLNELENVAKTAINANYEDIQKIQDGTTLIGNSEKLDGATLSKFATETLQNSDTKVPTSSQVKQYVDGAISNIDLSGYYTKRETDELLEEDYYSKDETIPCFVGTEENPVEITEAFASLDNLDDDLIYVKGPKTLCGTHHPSGELFFMMPGLHYHYSIYDIAGGKMYAIIEAPGQSPSVVGTSYTMVNILDGDYYNPVNLDEIDSGTYILATQASYILGDVTYHLGNSGYLIVNVGNWNNNVRKYMWSDGTVIEVERVLDDDTYSYNIIKQDELITNEETYDMITENINGYAEYVDETYAKTTDIPDLTDYVKNTDFPTTDGTKSGAVKLSTYYSSGITSAGIIYAQNETYTGYNNRSNNAFISKGTLENVITGKGLINNQVNNLANYYTKTEIDNTIGDINTAIDSINGEVI